MSNFSSRIEATVPVAVAIADSAIVIVIVPTKSVLLAVRVALGRVVHLAGRVSKIAASGIIVERSHCILLSSHHRSLSESADTMCHGRHGHALVIGYHYHGSYIMLLWSLGS